VEAWAALERVAIPRRRGRPRVLEGDGRRTAASLWTLIHVLWALGDLRRLHPAGDAKPDIVNYVDRYRWRDGFAARPGTRRRFFDDDAWLGLAALHLGKRDLAAEALAFVRTGQDAAGGFRWVEDATTQNTCSTASAAWLALELGDADLAGRAMDWLNAALRTPEGLYMDRVDEGRIDPTIWSYNQGAAVAALGLLGREDRAATTAAASLALFTGERLWREPPPFLAIWFRALLGNLAVRGETAAVLERHTDRLLAEALDRATGLFTRGGVGSYDGNATIDQAAIVQLFAMRELEQGRSDISRDGPNA
jgi:hypothetical protein